MLISYMLSNDKMSNNENFNIYIYIDNDQFCQKLSRDYYVNYFLLMKFNIYIYIYILHLVLPLLFLVKINFAS